MKRLLRLGKRTESAPPPKADVLYLQTRPGDELAEWQRVHKIGLVIRFATGGRRLAVRNDGLSGGSAVY